MAQHHAQTNRRTRTPLAIAALGKPPKMDKTSMPNGIRLLGAFKILAALALALVFTPNSHAGSISIGPHFFDAPATGQWRFDAEFPDEALADWNVTINETTKFQLVVLGGNAGLVTGDDAPSTFSSLVIDASDIQNRDFDLTGMAFSDTPDGPVFEHFYATTAIGNFTIGTIEFITPHAFGQRRTGLNGTNVVDQIIAEGGPGDGFALSIDVNAISFGDPATHPVPLPIASWMGISLLAGLGAAKTLRRRVA